MYHILISLCSRANERVVARSATARQGGQRQRCPRQQIPGQNRFRVALSQAIHPQAVSNPPASTASPVAGTTATTAEQGDDEESSREAEEGDTLADKGECDVEEGEETAFTRPADDITGDDEEDDEDFFIADSLVGQPVSSAVMEGRQQDSPTDPMTPGLDRAFLADVEDAAFQHWLDTMSERIEAELGIIDAAAISADLMLAMATPEELAMSSGGGMTYSEMLQGCWTPRLVRLATTSFRPEASRDLTLTARPEERLPTISAEQQEASAAPTESEVESAGNINDAHDSIEAILVAELRERQNDEPPAERKAEEDLHFAEVCKYLTPLSPFPSSS